MTRKTVFGLVSLASLATVQPASADWQYTKWGMTVPQVAAASGGKATPLTDKGLDRGTDIVRLQAPYTSGAFVFTARFLFDASTERLSRVDLKLENGKMCADLHGALYTKYGPPDTTKPSVAMLSIWRDRASSSTISLLTIGGDSCTLGYAPMRNSNNQGL
jgi:hypothetical protein